MTHDSLERYRDLILRIKKRNKNKMDAKIVESIIQIMTMWCNLNEKTMLYFPSKAPNLCCEGLLNFLLSLEDNVKDLT